jgi:gliding motility-associated-like protein
MSAASSFASGSGLSVPGIGCLNKDAGNYYYFAPNYFTQQIIRLNFGSSIHNTPTVTNLGSFGMTAGSLDGIDIVKDSATNLWYGLAVNYSQMVVLSFGTSLSNTPTSTITTYTAPTMAWGHQITIKRYLGNWIAFLANRSSNITRFDFGSSLTNPPTVTNIPNVGGVATPSSFSLYQQGANWYMLIPDLISGNLARYNFGTNLMNNSPTGTSLGNPGGLISLPRPINILNDCNGNVVAYVGNESGRIVRLNFGGSITNVPTATNLGTIPLGRLSSASPVSYSDTFSFVCSDASTNMLWLYTPLNFTPTTYINYYNPNQTYTFTSTGTYPVSLFCDFGYTSSPYVYCKDVVVVSSFPTTSRKDTTVCSGSSVTLTASATGPHTWSTGATGSSITASSAGVYWVSTITGPCLSKVDTFHLNVSASLPVNLGPDVAICPGDSVILSPGAPSGSTFTWNTGATSSSLKVKTAGTYWVTVNNSSCLGHDTIQVTVKNPPVVNLGNDIVVCTGDPVTLKSANTYTSPVYLWSTGSSASTINPTTTNTYWLQVTADGCTGRDSVNVSFIAPPAFDLGKDTFMCNNSSITLYAPAITGALYFWNNGSSFPYTVASYAGTYTVKITVNGCSAYDSITVAHLPAPIVDLGNDTVLCIGGTALLFTNSADAALWNDGSTNKSLEVTKNGTYWVAVTNDCGTRYDTVSINFQPCDLVFPGAFTPNGDGKNDIAKMYGDLDYVSNFSLSIYNRWGERVFYTTDIYAGWNGRYKFVEQDAGTFYYMANYIMNGKKQTIKGDLHLLR